MKFYGGSPVEFYWSNKLSKEILIILLAPKNSTEFTKSWEILQNLLENMESGINGICIFPICENYEL